MSAGRCPLVWKAAALEDGRLEGADLASFEDHASRCADCRSEKKALAAVSATVRAVTPPALPPLEHARRRGTLLARANERFTRPPRVGWRIGGALAGAAVAVGLTALHLRRAEAPVDVATRAAEAASPAPRYEILTSDRAVWRARLDGVVTRVEVADGEATFHIEPLVAPQRFLVSLPDGEVEVASTRFTVEVALGRTRRVDVVDGLVVLRRRDTPEMTLRAGEGWTRSEPAARARDAPVDPASSAPALPGSATRSDPGPLRHAAAAQASGPAAAGASPSLLAGQKFDEAIGSFVHGSYSRADVDLREFMADFPGDPRCEDASFLRAVARWRMGDAEGARARAQAYLATYPAGLRRAEAQHIVDAAR